MLDQPKLLKHGGHRVKVCTLFYCQYYYFMKDCCKCKACVLNPTKCSINSGDPTLCACCVALSEPMISALTKWRLRRRNDRVRQGFWSSKYTLLFFSQKMNAFIRCAFELPTLGFLFQLPRCHKKTTCRVQDPGS